MTRDESLTIVSLVVSGWPQAKEMDRDDVDLYARSIQDMDAELTTHSVLKMIKDTPWQPHASQLRDRVRIEKRLLAVEVAPIVPPEGEPVPFWVKRWICARMLYKSFGKEKDTRRFKEAGDHGDKTQELMPEGAWVEEANTLDDAEVVRRWKQAIHS